MKTPAMKEEAVRLYESGLTQAETADRVGVHKRTVMVWLRAAGVKARPSHTPDPDKRGQAVCLECGREFEYLLSQAVGKYCSEQCRLSHARKSARANNAVCPCGQEIKPTGKTRHTYRKYCSPKCRSEYGGKRQPDPANQVTFNCETCGKEVTRWKGYGGGANRFCSNLCAAKHTKTVRHYMARDSDVVLDSTWEMLFYSTLAFLKIPVERTDRGQGVEWREGNWYAPDFYLPRLGLWIEIKGQEDPEDVVRWAAFRKRVGPLAVLDRDALEAIRSLDRDGVEDRLRALSATTVAG